MRMSRRSLTTAGAAAVGLGALFLTRRMTSTWGTFDGEHDAALPGDDLVPDAVIATRGVTIDAPPTHVWPWVAQIGQGRGGFYSYDALENLLGLNIHSANRVEERWQDIRVGDQIRLAEDLPLGIVEIAPGRHLVLVGTVDQATDDPAPAPVAFTWAFVVLRLPDGRSRLMVRERYSRHPLPARIMAEVIGPISFVMSAKMLRGIRDRVEHHARAQGTIAPGLGAPASREA